MSLVSCSVQSTGEEKTQINTNNKKKILSLQLCRMHEEQPSRKGKGIIAHLTATGRLGKLPGGSVISQRRSRAKPNEFCGKSTLTPTTTVTH